MTQQPIGDRATDQNGNKSDLCVTISTFPEFCWVERSPESLFEKVERAKQEWETTVDSLPEIVCLVDAEGHIVRANRTIEAWGLGLVTAVRGLGLHDLIHPGCVSLFCALDRFLHQAIKQASEGQPDELEIYDATLGRHLLVRASPVPARKGIVTNTLVIVMQDISDHKKTEHALRRYNQRLEAMDEIQKAILAARSPEDIAQAALSRIRQSVPFHQARVTLFDPKSGEFLVLAADANGETHLRLSRSMPEAAFRSSQNRRPNMFFVIEDLTKLSDTSVVEQQLLREGIRSYLSVPLVAEGEFIGSLGLGSSQPDAFNQEHIGIAHQVSHLLAIATRQSRLVSQLKQANKELQDALQIKDQMIQNVSHELRTPISVFYAYTELLADAGLGPLTDEQQRAVQVMYQQGERLRFMVDRLLALQTFDAKNLQRVQLDPVVWLKQTMQTWEKRLAQTKSKIQFRLELPSSLPSLVADPNLIGQVILNLLDNASKFSPQGGLGRVRAWTEKGQIIIAVSDEGIGVPPDKLSRLFERFYQVDGSSTRRFGGMGIGLALCRVIVEAHGGRIWAESAGEGRGSTFYVALPADGRKEALDDKRQTNSTATDQTPIQEV